MNPKAKKWIRFLRQYGPSAYNDSMYDETIQRFAKQQGVQPITFQHPFLAEVLSCYDIQFSRLTSVVLTGTAGDGKTHLCRQVWEHLGGDDKEWEQNNPYISTIIALPNGTRVALHLIRDLSAWVPQRGLIWEKEKTLLLQQFSRIIFTDDVTNIFLIAANDGQLIETWRRLETTPDVERVRELFELLLVRNRQAEEGVNLRFFNLSRGRSSQLFDQALAALLSHEGWQACYEEARQASFLTQPASDSTQAFGVNCPIRHNYELLKNPLVQKRIRCLFELCDYNDLHIPIRQILLLLSNSILGHPGVKDQLMTLADIPKIIREGSASSASLYNNIFGGNLSESRRETITIFDYLDRFRIGHETSNRIDHLLIFGENDDVVQPLYDQLLVSDRFYGAGENYKAAQRDYIEGVDEEESRKFRFLTQLTLQRRGLFFKIPEDHERELKFWELTVFSFAGEYLSKVVEVLKDTRRVDKQILNRLVKGLNRIFTGMLVSSDQYLFVATSLSFSNAKISRMLEAKVSVRPDRGERLEIVLVDGQPVLNVVLAQDLHIPLRLSLTRYEFLSRVAEGALPSSFSRECYEDTLAFKSRVLGGLAERRKRDGDDIPGLTFHLLDLDEAGTPSEKLIEVKDD